ncbi:MAG TPA: AraC family transcriptional regulator [Gammaproteobacteria bacterium]|nr:AraC family transcriptional regulator [Gammaproteobacteria bacterium]
MLKTTVSLAPTAGASLSEDVLSHVLNAMRISGSLLLKERYTTPWGVSVPDTHVLNTLLNTRHPVRIAAFHLVEQGFIHIKPDDHEAVLVEAGEMVVCFSGKAHTLFQGSSSRIVPFQDLMSGTGNLFAPDNEITPCTSLLCGVFMLQDTLLNPLLATLPAVIKFSVTHLTEFPRLYGVVNLLVQEFQHHLAGNRYVIQRYLEILCAEAIRVHLENLPDHSTGWLSALKDPLIGRTIEAIHQQPGHHWSVKGLAEIVAMSPSRFAARFAETLGESPMAYVTRWRMYIASRMLENLKNPVEHIANTVGYESLAAFSRAFKRHAGLPPATWRAQHHRH